MLYGLFAAMQGCKEINSLFRGFNAGRFYGHNAVHLLQSAKTRRCVQLRMEGLLQCEIDSRKTFWYQSGMYWSCDIAKIVCSLSNTFVSCFVMQNRHLPHYSRMDLLKYRVDTIECIINHIAHRPHLSATTFFPPPPRPPPRSAPPPPPQAEGVPDYVYIPDDFADDVPDHREVPRPQPEVPLAQSTDTQQHQE